MQRALAYFVAFTGMGTVFVLAMVLAFAVFGGTRTADPAAGEAQPDHAGRR